MEKKKEGEEEANGNPVLPTLKIGDSTEK